MTYLSSSPKRILVISLLLATAASLMPMPRQLEQGDQITKVPDLCSLSVPALKNEPPHITALLQLYFNRFSSCEFASARKLRKEPFKLRYELESLEQLYYAESTHQESYSLEIDTKFTIHIKAPTHWGLVRALDTLDQLFQENPDTISLPINIRDEPFYYYRGIMVDTSRHYLSVRTLERTIDALMLNKLNILHWHITDDESFPLLLTNYSQITNTSKFWDTAIFTKADVMHVVNYASIRGVAIVPEIDTPGHTWSWGKSADLANITLTCGTIKQYGQFDPTLEKTYEVVKSVMQDLSDFFPYAPYIHFGGDEVVKSCYDSRPSIKEFMDKNNIPDYTALEVYYRQRQKSIWVNEVKSKKSVLYWYNKVDNLPAEEDDIIHWWGATSEYSAIQDRTNRIILSDYSPLYIDKGVGNAFGNPYQTYETWKNIYKWNPIPKEAFKGTVIGAEAPLWGETNNESTHFIKLFIRSSVLADILWNPHTKETEAYYDFVARLVKVEDRMINSGFPVAPVTSDYCKRHTLVCFPTLAEQEEL